MRSTSKSLINLSAPAIGLSAAIALRRVNPKLDIAIIERGPPNPAARGAGLRLEVNGIKALRAVDPEIVSVLESNAAHASSIVSLDHTGSEIMKVDADVANATTMSKYGVKPLLLGWQELVQSLQDKVPAELVHYEAAVSNILEDSAKEYVEIFMENEAEPIQSKIVIGADGYHSIVAQQCLGLKPPTFEGQIIWRARLPASKSNHPLDRITLITGQGIVTISYPISNGDIVWTISASPDVLESRGLGHVVEQHRNRTAFSMTAEEKKQHCLSVIEDSPDWLKETVAATDANKMLEHGVWVRYAEDIPSGSLGDGRVSLVGDAFHPVRPTGQGVNTALEDAHALAFAVAQLGVTKEALRKYEGERIDRVKSVAANTLQTGRAAYEQKDKNERRKTLASSAEFEATLFGKDWKDLRDLTVV